MIFIEIGRRLQALSRTEGSMRDTSTGRRWSLGWPSRAGAVVAAVVAAAGCGGGEPCGGPGVICPVAGSGEAGTAADGTAALEAPLSAPVDVAMDPAGRLLVMEIGNHRVVRIDGDRIETLIGNAELAGGQEGSATGVAIPNPTHVTVAPDGGLLVSTWYDGVVGEVADGSYTRRFGTGDFDSCGDGGPARAASFEVPVATAIDSSGRIYVAALGSGRVRRIDTDGTVETFIGPPAADGDTTCCGDDGCTALPFGYAGDGGSARSAYLYPPFGGSAWPGFKIALGPDDRLYIADTLNQRVRAVRTDQSDPVIVTVAGSGGAECVPGADGCAPVDGGYAGDGILATDARLNNPSDVAVAPDGTLFIADTDNHCIRRVDIDGTITSAAGLCGYPGDAGDGGLATEARLNRPLGVALAADGALYIADTGNRRVRVVTP
jgi:hypothetical protein